MRLGVWARPTPARMSASRATVAPCCKLAPPFFTAAAAAAAAVGPSFLFHRASLVPLLVFLSHPLYPVSRSVLLHCQYALVRSHWVVYVNFISVAHFTQTGCPERTEKAGVIDSNWAGRRTVKSRGTVAAVESAQPLREKCFIIFKTAPMEWLQLTIWLRTTSHSCVL